MTYRPLRLCWWRPVVVLHGPGHPSDRRRRDLGESCSGARWGWCRSCSCGSPGTRAASVPAGAQGGTGGVIGGLGLVLAFAGSIFAFQTTTVANAVFLFAASPFFARRAGLAGLARTGTAGDVDRDRGRLSWDPRDGARGVGGRRDGGKPSALDRRWVCGLHHHAALGQARRHDAGGDAGGPLRDRAARWSWRFGARRCGCRPRYRRGHDDGRVPARDGDGALYPGSRVVPAAELTLLSMVEVMLGPVWSGCC